MIIPLPAAAVTGFYNTFDIQPAPDGTMLLVSFDNKLYPVF